MGNVSSSDGFWTAPVNNRRQVSCAPQHRPVMGDCPEGNDDQLVRNIMAQDRLLFMIPRAIVEDDQMEMDIVYASGARIFSISLICDYNPESGKPYNIAYHFKVDFEQDVIIQNRKVDGAWDQESTNAQVIDSDRRFKLGILFKAGKALTFINEGYHSSTDVVHPLGSIRYLHCWNDIEKVECFTFRYN